MSTREIADFINKNTNTLPSPDILPHPHRQEGWQAQLMEALAGTREGKAS